MAGFKELLNKYAQTPEAAGGNSPCLIVTCFSPKLTAKLEPALGLNPGEAAIIRTRGGQVSEETLKDILMAVILHKITNIFVIAHNDCQIADLSLADFVSECANRKISRQNFPSADLRGWLGIFHQVQNMVRDGVEKIQTCPFLPADLTIHGLTFDPTTGSLETIEEGIKKIEAPATPVIEESKIVVPNLITTEASHTQKTESLVHQGAMQDIATVQRSNDARAKAKEEQKIIPGQASKTAKPQTPTAAPGNQANQKAPAFSYSQSAPTNPPAPPSGPFTTSAPQTNLNREQLANQQWEIWLEDLGIDPGTVLNQINRLTGKNFSRYTILGQAILQSLPWDRAEKIAQLWESWGAKVILRPQKK